jgi:hypothetical protein
MWIAFDCNGAIFLKVIASPIGLLGSIFAKKIYKNNNKHVNKERLKGSPLYHTV